MRHAIRKACTVRVNVGLVLTRNVKGGAMSAGVVMGIGKPPWIVTPLSKPKSLTAICPWS